MTAGDIEKAQYSNRIDHLRQCQPKTEQEARCQSYSETEGRVKV